MADDYLKQMVCEAYYKGSVFLGGIPGQRLVMLANELSDNGNIEASMVLETEGGEPRFFSAEMSFDDGLKVLGISVRKGRNEDHNAKTDNQQCSEGCPVAESPKGTAAQAEAGEAGSQKREKEMNDEANWCCHIDPETEKGCEADAELLIVSGYSPDDQIHACPLHVEDLMVDGPFNYVFPLADSLPLERASSALS